jgi:hypothetical protein
MAERTWETRERPLLEAVLSFERDGVDKRLYRPERIAVAAGLDIRDATLGLVALIEAGYLRGTIAGINRPVPNVRITEITERARRETGQWPSESAYNDLVELLDQRIEATTDEPRKSKLRAVRDAVVGLGREITTDVLAKVIEHQTGMG